MGVLDQPIASRLMKMRTRANENPREDEDRSLGLQEVLSGPQKEDGALRPPCSQQLCPDDGPLLDVERGRHQDDVQRGQVSYRL